MTKERLGGLAKLILAVDASYQLRLQRQQKFNKENWEGFDILKEDLSKIVVEGFDELLEKIDLGNAKILDYKVGYVPRLKTFKIVLTKLKLSDGKIMDDNDIIGSDYCPHCDFYMFYGSKINSDVEEFKEKYNVQEIFLPKNFCNHL